MYEVIFYKDVHGNCPVKEAIQELDTKAHNNKNARIQLKQIYFQIGVLENVGSRCSNEIAKHLRDGIWELRPGDNRILFAPWKDNVLIFLNIFRKKGRSTPEKEIDGAKRKLNDWIKRHGQ